MGPRTKVIRGLPSVLEDFGAGDVGGHKVGRELDALEVEMENPRDGFDEQRLGQPGAPVIRQWPPAKSAMRICSITSFWPTMTLPSSASIWTRPATRRSTVSRWAAEAGAAVCSGGSERVFIDLDSSFGESTQPIVISHWF